MTSSADYDDYKAGTKYPIFNGERENWKFYKKMMQSYLARVGLGELLQKAVGEKILKDGATPVGSDEDKEEALKLRKANRKAAGILLSSLDYKTSKGQVAFSIVERFHDENDGYAGGH